MRVLIQRVKEASVTVEGEQVSSIADGMLLFVGIGKLDTSAIIERMAKKIAGLRIFDDPDGKMNLNLQQADAAILSVPQFTLYADTSRGNRPGFESAALPEDAKKLWQELNTCLRKNNIDVKEGVFASDMQVALINNGPVTIWLDSDL